MYDDPIALAQRLLRRAAEATCALLLLLGCAPRGAARFGAEAGGDSLRLPRPTVPIHITSPEGVARYLVSHYWDAADLRSPLTEDDELLLEARLVDYIGLVQSLPPEEATDWLLAPLRRSSDATLLPLLSLYKTYLYDSGSPMVSDACYEGILSWCLETPRLSRELQTAARNLLERVRLNPVGGAVSDFIYTKVDGSRHRLVNQTAPHTLLVFATAHCHTCHKALEQIGENEQLRADVARGDLGVLVVYIQTSPEAYAEEASGLPDWITSGYDASGAILDKPLYDIKVSPTLYVINRAGKVVIKDLDPERLPTLTTRSISNND